MPKWRTTSSVTSVGTPDAFFGHHTHNMPSLSTRLRLEYPASPAMPQEIPNA